MICLNYGRSAIFENPTVQEWKDMLGKVPEKGSLISPHDALFQKVAMYEMEFSNEPQTNEDGEKQTLTN